MSGVVDANGQQWERCNECGEFVRIQDLGYQKPNAQHPYGRDLCVKCVDKLLRARKVRFSHIRPAAGWKRVLVERS